MSTQSKYTHTHTHIYIYIYIYVVIRVVILSSLCGIVNTKGTSCQYKAVIRSDDVNNMLLLIYKLSLIGRSPVATDEQVHIYQLPMYKRLIFIMTPWGTSGGVTVGKLDERTYTNEFESHWAPHSFGLVPHRSKELCKLLYSL